MNITTTYSMAKQVKNKVVKSLSVYNHKFRDCHMIIGCFQNCREQGFTITLFSGEKNVPYSVAFSENRNSDDIVIYKGAGFWNRYEDVVWCNYKFCETVDDAVLEIISILATAHDFIIK